MTDGLEEMRGLVHDLPNQIDRGWARFGDLELDIERGDVEAVIVAGMGGSAISGDLAAAAFAGELAVPIIVVRDYRLPGWASSGSLFVASSFSGNTEETLSAYREAGGRGMPRVAITTGGVLGESATRDGVPVVTLPPDGPPRAALGSSLTAMMGVLKACGLIADPSEGLSQATSAMSRLVAAEAAPASETSPAHIAAGLEGRIPIVAAPADIGPVARRWKTQFNENAKTTAAWDTIPEIDHNTIVGLAMPPRLGDAVGFVFLSGPSTHERTLRRISVTTDLLDSAGIPHAEVAAPAGPRLAEMLWLVQFGDLVSVHTAERYGVDPMPIESIDRLKAALGAPRAP